MWQGAASGLHGQRVPEPWHLAYILSGHHSSNFNCISENGVQDPGVSSICYGPEKNDAVCLLTHLEIGRGHFLLSMDFLLFNSSFCLQI